MPLPLSSDILQGIHKEVHAPCKWKTADSIPIGPHRCLQPYASVYVGLGSLRITNSHLCTLQNVLSQLYISGDSDYLLSNFICWYIASTYQQWCYQHIWGCSMWRVAARQPRGRKHGGEVPPVSVLKIFFFLPPLTLIAVQWKLPQFKYSWEYIELLGDAINYTLQKSAGTRVPWACQIFSYNSTPVIWFLTTCSDQS